MEGDIAIGLAPYTTIPLNTSECLCDSINELVQEITSIETLTTTQHLNYSCTANSLCDGLRCRLEIPNNPVYFNITLLPCPYPPAVDVVLEDSIENTVAQWVFTKTESIVLEFPQGLKITFDTVIVNHENSIEVEVCIYILVCVCMCVCMCTIICVCYMYIYWCECAGNVMCYIAGRNEPVGLKGKGKLQGKDQGEASIAQ